MTDETHTWHSDQSMRHQEAGRITEARHAALLSGYKASEAGEPCQPPAWMQWTKSGGTYFEIGGYWVAGWQMHRDLLKEQRAKQRKQEKRAKMVVSDLFPDQP